MESLKSITIPLSNIGDGVSISLGSHARSNDDDYHFDSPDTPWLRPFLSETQLLGQNAQHLSGKLFVTRESNVVRVRGEFVFEPMLECVRSLTPFRERIEAGGQGVFIDRALERGEQASNKRALARPNKVHEVPRSSLRFGGHLETTGKAGWAAGDYGDDDMQAAAADDRDGLALRAEDLEVYTYVKGALQLDEFILDTLQTALPDRPLCRPDCQGLCSECGESLNDRLNCGQADCPLSAVLN